LERKRGTAEKKGRSLPPENPSIGDQKKIRKKDKEGEKNQPSSRKKERPSLPLPSYEGDVSRKRKEKKKQNASEEKR